VSAIERISDHGRVKQVLDKAKNESERILEILRSVATETVGNNDNIIIGVNGSVARREFTSGSDADFFVLTTDDSVETAKDIQERCHIALESHGLKRPSPGGVFDDPLPISELTSNIGGQEDTNTLITRRMLYLLEGDWVFNESLFNNLRADLIKRYVPDDLKERKLCRYLLNDVIRYWRTICVDFESKTANAEKARAIRLVKLRLSRMMLYFAGVAAIRQTSNQPAPTKRKTLDRLFGMPSVDRLIDIFGVERTAPALAPYATFLHALDDPNIRQQLNVKGKPGLETEEYRELIKVAREFRHELQRLLTDKQSEQIALALMF
jgi:hypothetical protein